jgi:transposase
MNIRYRVTLTPEERQQLEALVRGGKGAVRKLKRAQILLAADARSTDEAIAGNVGVGTSTVYRTKQRFVEDGLERALNELPRPGPPRKLSASDEALLVAVACSSPPPGQARWTLELLAGELVRLTVHETLSGDTVGRRLAEMELKPWQEKMWCIPTVNSEYVARMEDVLDLYAEAPDPLRPVICFDETPRQLIGEERVPIRAEPGKPARVDYEYVRNGTANVFMFVDVNRPWRHAKVTDQRTCIDFAECMRDLVDEDYPEAEKIRVVLDNLSAHSAAALYQAFEPAEARRILSRLEFHFTPKHASWLNMVEIEIGVMVKQCLDRRIADKATLISEIAAWERRRNATKARIKWMFTVERARQKMGRAYPQPTRRSQQAAA